MSGPVTSRSKMMHRYQIILNPLMSVFVDVKIEKITFYFHAQLHHSWQRRAKAYRVIEANNYALVFH
jgi:hypothetical protein